MICSVMSTTFVFSVTKRFILPRYEILNMLLSSFVCPSTSVVGPQGSPKHTPYKSRIKTHFTPETPQKHIVSKQNATFQIIVCVLHALENLELQQLHTTRSLICGLILFPSPIKQTDDEMPPAPKYVLPTHWERLLRTDACQLYYIVIGQILSMLYTARCEL